MDRFTAGCLCGNIRIVAAGQPYRVGICHAHGRVTGGVVVNKAEAGGRGGVNESRIR